MPGFYFTWALKASALFPSATKDSFSAALNSPNDYGLHVVEAADITHHLKFNSFNEAIPTLHQQHVL